MRCVIQRVNSASVTIDKNTISRIENGLLVLIAIHVNDTEQLIKKMADKIINLRIFEDQAQKMNKSILDTGGEILLVSQFTLYGDSKKGNRPSFINSARPEKAEDYYKKLLMALKEKNIKVQTGQFQSHMQVELINDGPTTIIVDL